jgi:hypothetical protein
MSSLAGYRGVWMVVLGLCALGDLACDVEPVDQTPEAVVEEFITRLRRVHGDPKRARAAYELLWSGAKQRLAERAKRAGDVMGRPVGPEEMIVPSWFTTRFEPRRYDARVEGGWAIVRVLGPAPNERHEVRCVNEEGGWRVVVDIPEQEPIERRIDRGRRP